MVDDTISLRKLPDFYEIPIYIGLTNPLQTTLQTEFSKFRVTNEQVIYARYSNTCSKKYAIVSSYLDNDVSVKVMIGEENKITNDTFYLNLNDINNESRAIM